MRRIRRIAAFTAPESPLKGFAPLVWSPSSRPLSMASDSMYSVWAEGDRSKRITMVEDSSTPFLIPSQDARHIGRITVVLDLDETLVSGRDHFLVRPGVDKLLALVCDKFEPVIWTAGVRKHALGIMSRIDPTGTIEQCVYRHGKWFSSASNYYKDLSLLGRDMDKVIIVENSVGAFREHLSNGVVVADYADRDDDDPTIPVVCEILEELHAAHMASGTSVPNFLQSCRHLQAFTAPSLNRQRVHCVRESFAREHARVKSKL